ncbi:uncharacterized protein LOC128242253 [Mya arenaria]|uniref:uncharacterized protein LOC128242253 n=1 Tax=Mya arenaria TaxID=6604 RepID=UPI0022E71556|nr:uncharacterized protein LOC128242253 [Mya arenaria]
MQRMAPGGPQHMQDPNFSRGNIPYHGHPGNQHNDFNAPEHFAPHDQVAPGYNHAPHVQVMIRDANTPITRYITPSMVSIIVKRVLSVAVLIFNEILNWLKYFDWIGTIDLPAMFGYIGKKGKQMSSFAVQTLRFYRRFKAFYVELPPCMRYSRL